jgi:hypothetical protein
VRGSIVFGFSFFTTPSPRMFQLGYGEGLKEESARKTPAKIKEERDRDIIILKIEKDNLLWTKFESQSFLLTAYFHRSQIAVVVYFLNYVIPFVLFKKLSYILLINKI